MLKRLISQSAITLFWSISTTSLLNTCLVIVLTNVLCQILQEKRNDTVKQDSDLLRSVMLLTFTSIWYSTSLFKEHLAKTAETLFWICIYLNKLPLQIYLRNPIIICTSFEKYFEVFFKTNHAWRVNITIHWMGNFTVLF